MNSYHYLSDLIKDLESFPQHATIKYGFHNPHSFRGYYCDLAFEPLLNAKVSDMLECAKEANGSTYTGWKGGEYKMEDNSDCYISEEGQGGGNQIGSSLVAYWRDETKEQ